MRSCQGTGCGSRALVSPLAAALGAGCPRRASSLSCLVCQRPRHPSTPHGYPQAGLAALNAPLHVQRSRADPLHLATYAGLAEGLPRAKHSHSHLICAISHVPMDEHNPPLVMKNGHVYGQAALRAQADRDDGVVTCPVTGKDESTRGGPVLEAGVWLAAPVPTALHHLGCSLTCA